MDETGKRLRDSADQCVNAYETWTKSKKDLAARENLLEAVHELRKVAARLEIEIAASERDEMTQRTLPIPPHRSSRPRRGGEGDDFGPENDDNTGNTMPSDDRQPSSNAGVGGHGGGGHSGGGGQRRHHGGQRRPMRSNPDQG